MKTKIILAALCLSSGFAATAQTSFINVSRTSGVQAASNFRNVDGQRYNTNSNKAWRTQKGKIIEVRDGGIVLQTFTIVPIYESYYIPLTANQRAGAYSATPGGWQKRQVGSETIEAQRLFIKNYTGGAMDQEISILAMKTGTINLGGEKVFEQWDCGKPLTPAQVNELQIENDKVLTAIENEKAEKAAAKQAKIDATKAASVKWNQEQADNGDSYGLQRMGERYRDGDGVPIDLSKAREYLAKAATAGSIAAMDALEKLKQGSTNSPAAP